MKPALLLCVLWLLFASVPAQEPQTKTVTFTHYGHACYLITTSQHTRILTDPMKLEGYAIPDSVKPDVVTVSHRHIDHDNVAGVAGNPLVLYGVNGPMNRGLEHKFIPVDTQIKDVRIHNLVSNHFDPKRSPALNSIFLFEFDSLRVVHLGDLGYRLTDQQIAEITPVDVVMIPIGGVYTLTPAEADSLIARLKPRMVVLPMHFKTAAADFLEYTVDDFLRGKSNVKEIAGTSFTLDRRDPPRETECVVLGYPSK